MALSVITMSFVILSCGFWVVKARKYNSILTVPNGGRWGSWGTPEFCPKGYAIGFGLRVEQCGTAEDATGLNVIALMCDDGKVITSATASWGIWDHEVKYCPKGSLIGFTLNVQQEIDGDNTAANNIAFRCNDKAVLIGDGIQEGTFSPMINRCRKGSKICGIQTKVQYPQFEGDDTALNDVKMFCCD